MYIILLILIFILFIILKNIKENMGSMSPDKYIILIDLEYLAKRNEFADKLLAFLNKNISTAKLFLGNHKLNVILNNSNDANLYYKSRFESTYPNLLLYHTPKSATEFNNLIKGRTILYMGDKQEMEARNLDNRLLNSEEQLKYYTHDSI